MVRRKEGFVYFIRCPINGLIKIGWTAGDPTNRFARIRSLSPVPLELVATHPGTVEDERALHEQFGAAWSHGEWFRPDQELLDYIAAEGQPWSDRCETRTRRLVVPIPPKPSVAVWAQDTILVSRGISRTVAEWSVITGVSELAFKFRLAKGMSPDHFAFFFGGNSPKLKRSRWWDAPIPKPPG